MDKWIEILLRSVSLFFVAFIITKISGKKNTSRVSPFRFINYVVIGILAALISVNVITNLTFGFIALAVWTILPVALDFLSVKSKAVHDIIHGKETVVIKHGKIMENNLMQTRLTGEDLLRELRFKNIFNLADVEFAVMEATGDINALLKSDKKPVSAHDMGIKVSPRAESQTVIMDGNIINEALSSLGLNKEWLGTQLENSGVSLDNVFLGQVDSSGDLYLDLFDDSIEVPRPKVKEMLYANLEKCQADLTTFFLETQDDVAKNMYKKNADRLQRLMEKLKPYLLR